MNKKELSAELLYTLVPTGRW